MLRAFNIAWKDIRHVYRDIASLAMMFIAPLLLAGAIGSAFGTGDNYSIAAVKTVVVDQDTGAGAGSPAAGAALTAALTSPQMADLLDVTLADTPEAARAAVDEGDAAAAVIIPPGLSEALAGAGAGGPAAAAVEIYKDPALNVGPSIVAAVVDSVAQTFNGARAAASAAARLAVSLGMTDPAQITEIATKAAQAFAAAAQAGAAQGGAGQTGAAPSGAAQPEVESSGAAQAGTAPTGAPVTLEARNPTIGGADAKRPNVASQVLVGMMLFFMMFGASIPARSILDEHRQGTLSRLFTTPTPRSVILGGKYVAVFLVVLIQAAVLLVAGRFLLGADWGEPGPVAVLTLASALVAASLGLVTTAFAKTPGQAGAVSSAIFVFLGLISGNFMGTVTIGGAFAVARRVSPLGWLMEGWGNLLYGGSWGSIALQVAVALVYALVLFGIASFFFRRRYA
jgi:ABC-2 type transport system permease protein